MKISSGPICEMLVSRFEFEEDTEARNSIIGWSTTSIQRREISVSLGAFQCQCCSNNGKAPEASLWCGHFVSDFLRSMVTCDAVKYSKTIWSIDYDTTVLFIPVERWFLWRSEAVQQRHQNLHRGHCKWPFLAKMTQHITAVLNWDRPLRSSDLPSSNNHSLMKVQNLIFRQ